MYLEVLIVRRYSNTACLVASMKNASDKASLRKGQHTPSVLHEMVNSERTVIYLSRLPALSHIIDEGGQKGGKTA